jgi:hypothetical protein
MDETGWDYNVCFFAVEHELLGKVPVDRDGYVMIPH